MGTSHPVEPARGSGRDPWKVLIISANAFIFLFHVQDLLFSSPSKYFLNRKQPNKTGTHSENSFHIAGKANFLFFEVLTCKCVFAWLMGFLEA